MLKGLVLFHALVNPPIRNNVGNDLETEKENWKITEEMFNQEDTLCSESL